jgi:transcriptional regulator CtsR
MELECGLGFEPTNRELEKLGYNIESKIPGTGKLRIIEVKGGVSYVESLTVTKNELLYSLHKPEDFILVIVEFIHHEYPILFIDKKK